MYQPRRRNLYQVTILDFIGPLVLCDRTPRGRDISGPIETYLRRVQAVPSLVIDPQHGENPLLLRDLGLCGAAQANGELRA